MEIDWKKLQADFQSINWERIKENLDPKNTNVLDGGNQVELLIGLGLAYALLLLGHVANQNTSGTGWGPNSGLRLIENPEVPVFKDKKDFAERVTAAVRVACAKHGYPEMPTDMILTAQFALESGWGKHARGWNLGGIHAGSAWNGPYFNSTDASRPTKFCAFRDLEDFVESGYFRFLSFGRYAKSKALLLAGDLDFYAQLGRDGYYEATPESYKAGSINRLNTIKALLGR